MDVWHIRELITRRAYRICMLPAVSFALLTRVMADILFPWLLPIYVCFFFCQLRRSGGTIPSFTT